MQLLIVTWQLDALANLEWGLDLVQGFWQSPKMPTKPGLKAVDLFKAVDEGEIKAIWIMSTNPVDSLPDADFVAQALEKCPFATSIFTMAR